MQKSNTLSRFIAVAILFPCLSTLSSAEVVLTFDELSTGSKPGSVYSAVGVHFSYGEIISTVSIGNQIEFETLSEGLEIVSGPFAISGSNAASTFVNLDDNLMYFSKPLTQLSLITDDQAGETAADIIRLIALKPTVSPRIFTVIDFVESLDNGTTSATNTLALSFTNPVSYFAFQRTTESESFDDLRFTAVPEPTSALLCITAALAVTLQRRQRKPRSGIC
jgi:hypothetical protein